MQAHAMPPTRQKRLVVDTFARYRIDNPLRFFQATGGSMLRGISRRLSDKIVIEFHIANEPLLSVARVTGIALKNVDRFPFLMR